MKVTLLRHTLEAEDLLIFTKSTRLTLSPGLMESIKAWPQERKDEELKYIANTIKSSWEFIDYVFLIEDVSRGFTHQFVRTRQGSYAQQSMRVTNMSAFDFVMPEKIAAQPRAKELVEILNLFTARTYRELVEDLGIPAEDARSILPTNVSTNIIAKFNLRTLTEMGVSRLGGRTQAEYQSAMNAMVDLVLGVHPWTQEFFFGSLDRKFFDELEAFAKEAFPDLMQRGKLLKIVDGMRKNLK